MPERIQRKRTKGSKLQQSANQRRRPPQRRDNNSGRYVQSA